MKISYVIPCYRSENTIQGVVEEIQRLPLNSEYEYEIVLVNDSSPDNVWSKITELTMKNRNVVGVDLAKNFGQHAALLAGYSHASGDYIVSLDDDGQIAVEDTYKLVEELEKGYDVVYGKYHVKKHNPFRNWGSKLCGIMMRTMMDVPKGFAGSSFYVAKKYVIDEMTRYTNSYVFLPGLVFRTTNKVNSVYVNHRAREVGESGYTLKKLISLWVNGATTFSVKPLRISAFAGAMVACIGFILACALIIKKLLNPAVVMGWTSLVTIVLMLSGVILLVLGLMGEYVGRIYMSSNNSPQYVVRQTINDRDEDD